MLFSTSDTCISLHGRKQAEILRNSNQLASIEAVFSSPLRRAYETAKIVFGSSHSVRIKGALGLGEINFGSYAGLSYEDDTDEITME